MSDGKLRRALLKRLKAAVGEDGQRIRLPGKILFSADGDVLVMTLDRNCLREQNLQVNSTAVEAWALALHGAVADLCPVIRLELAPNLPLKALPPAGAAQPGASTRHYNRFLYRMWRFAAAFDWLRLSDTLRADVKLIARLYGAGVTNNLPTGAAADSKADPDNGIPIRSEFDLEAVLGNSAYLDAAREVTGVAADAFNRQLPVGIFTLGKGQDTADAVEESARLFTGGKSAIDLWCVHEQRLQLFELKNLKASDSASLGAISELFFYTCLVYDLFVDRENAARPNQTTKPFRGYDKLGDDLTGVTGRLVSNKAHPLWATAMRVLKRYSDHNSRICFADARLYELVPRPAAVAARRSQNCGHVDWKTLS